MKFTEKTTHSTVQVVLFFSFLWLKSKKYSIAKYTYSGNELISRCPLTFSSTVILLQKVLHCCLIVDISYMTNSMKLRTTWTWQILSADWVNTPTWFFYNFFPKQLLHWYFWLIFTDVLIIDKKLLIASNNQKLPI